MFLTSGNRAEVLVRCMRPGVYTLTAGRDPSPFGEPLNTNANSLKQAVVMTLAVTPGRPRAAHLAPCWQPLVPRACRPRFPAYATDLSDAALARAGATAKLSPQQAGFTSPNGVSGRNTRGCSGAVLHAGMAAVRVPHATPRGSCAPLALPLPAGPRLQGQRRGKYRLPASPLRLPAALQRWHPGTSAHSCCPPVPVICRSPSRTLTPTPCSCPWGWSLSGTSRAWPATPCTSTQVRC